MSGAAPDRGRRTVRFGAHQALEYLTAALVISTGIRLRTGLAAPVLLAGLAILALAAVTDGPWCAVRWLGRRAHAAGDWLVTAALIAVPLVALDLEADLTAAIVLWVAAALMAFLATSTDYRSRRERRAAGGPAATASPPTTSGSGGSDAVNAAARALGRQAGRAPRSLGRAVGRHRARKAR